ncbi:CRISPR-associated protein Cas4 [Tautonia marina]|uniref:CRISPR-associated protein Cas4 n=1 Tax=Tautonia marina TaxID=2653855 RepID=UPI0012605E1C|nr:Dna2/Cas4 domain-containing protein [Tautonia marina]
MSFPLWLGLLLALCLLGIGLLLVRAGRGLRQKAGLEAGRTVSLDQVTLTSKRLGLTGRPDRIVRQGDSVIPEEWKSARTLRPWHRAQMGVYFLLIEDRLGRRPSHGFIVLGDGTRCRIENTEALRAQVLGMAEQIRAIRQDLATPARVFPKPAQCRPCGMLPHCGQAARTSKLSR